jgi:anti-sigma B factor antagonist
MEITCIPTEQANILTLSGRLDGRNPRILKEKLTKELRTNNRIILDLSGVIYIDSTGLGVLVGGLKKAMRQEGDIRLVNPSNEVRMLMELTRVDKVFLIYSNQETALMSYSDNITEQPKARSSQ